MGLVGGGGGESRGLGRSRGRARGVGLGGGAGGGGWFIVGDDALVASQVSQPRGGARGGRGVLGRGVSVDWAFRFVVGHLWLRHLWQAKGSGH